MEIVTHPNEVLRQEAEPIGEITDEIRDLADKMTETMFREDGIGLAAPQVGVSKKLIVVNLEDEFHIVINPEIAEKSEEEESMVEGCLSIPGVEAPVSRSKEVLVRGKDLDEEEVELEKEGLPARVFQHEVDHVNGILFIDRLSEAERSITLREYRKAKEEDKEKLGTQSAI